MTSTKSYWSTLKMFLNNKKIPCIPPLKHQNKYVTDFKEKAEIFNSFFVEQCSLMKNSSKRPLIFLKRTDKFISLISFSSNNIARIIRDLDPNKADGHDMISIRILKICGESISRDGSRTTATSKMECFVIIANGWKPSTIITKLSILNVAAALDPSLIFKTFRDNFQILHRKRSVS